MPSADTLLRDLYKCGSYERGHAFLKEHASEITREFVSDLRSVSFTFNASQPVEFTITGNAVKMPCDQKKNLTVAKIQEKFDLLVKPIAFFPARILQLISFLLSKTVA